MVKNSIMAAMWKDQLALVKKNKVIVTKETVLEPFFQAGLTPLLTENGDVVCKEPLSSIEQQIVYLYIEKHKGKIISAIKDKVQPKTDVTCATRTREILGDSWVAECFPRIQDAQMVIASPLFTALVSKLRITRIASSTGSENKNLWQDLHEECRFIEAQREAGE